MSKNWKPLSSEFEAGVRGLNLGELHEDSKLTSTRAHYNHEIERPLVEPIYTASTYRSESVDHYLDILGEQGGYIYSRLGNPTTDAVECALNAVEGGAGCIAFNSGMAAISTALTLFLKSGDHMIIHSPVYSGTHKFLSKYLSPNYNVEVTWIPAGSSVDVYRNNVKDNTKILYAETPCNPNMDIIDLTELAALGKEKGIMTFVDNTFASPVCQKPISLGIDIVMESCTKYLGGHSDLMAGLVCTKTLENWQKLKVYATTLGVTLNPFDSHLLNRGLKTLHVRVERHNFNAQKLAEFLEAHPKVSRVYYPGLKSHGQHAIACKQMSGFGGMITFELKGGLEAGKTFVTSVQLMELAVSLGGTQSLLNHAASMTHGPMVMSDKEREEARITPGLIRFSVGLENVEDLKKDLSQALEKC
ncbi:unnamed protein product [Owenia fusiformis]|uniref:plant cystathionine gamma-synthase n=1 Tax=Owenia fusiformis TaxID=6347 RepID=A0A8J1UNF6_OWEFU|nr:unnamed protein product [Owenia fusiformis]